MSDDKRISELSVTDTLDGREKFVFEKNGDNGCVSADTLKDYMQEDWPIKIEEKQDKFTTSDDLSFNENVLSLTDMAKKRLLIDMWNSACGIYGTYNEDTGYFELNGITNIKYEEAIRIMAVYKGPVGVLAINEKQGQLVNVRTLIPYDAINAYTGEKGFFDLSNIEIVRLCKAKTILLFGNSLNDIFDRCPKIRRWEDEIFWFQNTSYGNSNKYTFIFDKFNYYHDNHPFEYFRFRNTNFNVNCRSYENIGIDSFQFLIENRWPLDVDGANPFVVTVHKKVYAKLTGDTTNDTYNNLTEEEKAQWTALSALAAEKQITFATT